MKRRWKWLAFAVGVAWFAFYLRGADLPTVGRQLRGLGAAAPLLLIPYFLVYLVDTAAWRTSFATPPRVGWWRLVRIRWCGESVNNVVPTAYVGGEALKVLLLAGHGVPARDAAAAALISKTAQTLSQVLFLAAGAAAFLVHAGNRPGLRVALAIVLGGGLGVVGLLFWWQRRGVFASLLGLARRVGFRPRWLAARESEFAGMDATISTFYREHRRRFLAATGLYLAGWLLDTLEVWLSAGLLGLPIAWSQALAVEAFTGVVKIIGLWVPGALGVQESGIVLLVRLAGGVDPLGATYALLRRSREVIFAAIGGAFLLVGGVPKAARAAHGP